MTTQPHQRGQARARPGPDPFSRLSVALLLLAALATGCTTYQPLDVLVVGITPAEGGPLEQRLTLALRFVNPNDRDIEATGMSLAFNVNAQPLARGVSDVPITVPRLGETVAEITVGTSLFDVARQVLALDTRRGELTYGLDGRLHLGGLRPPLRFEKSGVLKPAQARDLR